MKERTTSTINEDPSSSTHDEIKSPPPSATVVVAEQKSTAAGNNRGVLTKNPSFAMRSLTTRLSGFFRKFSTSVASNMPPTPTAASSSGGGGGGDGGGGDVCPLCHRAVRPPAESASGPVDSLATGRRAARRRVRRDGGGGAEETVDEEDDELGDDDDDAATVVEEVDFTSNILVGDLGNLTSILKKPTPFRHTSQELDHYGTYSFFLILNCTKSKYFNQ